jgi:hypothetical protein
MQGSQYILVKHIQKHNRIWNLLHLFWQHQNQLGIFNPYFFQLKYFQALSLYKHNFFDEDTLEQGEFMQHSF